MVALYRLRLLVAAIVVLLAGAAATLTFVGGSTPPAEQLLQQATATVPAAAATALPTPIVAQGVPAVQAGLRAIPVPGPRAEDFIILETIGPDRTLGQLIIWRTSGELKTQLFPIVSSQVPPPGPFQAVDSAIIGGMQQRSGDRRELGIVYDATAYGSGSPTSVFLLLRLEGDQWRIVWNAADHTPDWRSSHGRVEFPQGDLSELVVRSDSAFVRDDPLSGVLFEANAGPHRGFVDTWVRQGDSYVRTSAETVPSAYATLVEFLYALDTNDDSRARALVTDASLVERARGLGLDAYAGKNWTVGCADCNLQTGPISFYAGPPVVISFVQQNGAWLISDIQSEPSP